MIAIASSPKPKAESRGRNDRFLAMLPEIRNQASFAFRELRAEAHEERVQEVVATAYQLFCRLAQRGKLNLAYPTPLAQFAIGKVRAGRRMGSRCNSLDITSPCACTAKGIVIKRLDRFDRRTGSWREFLVEDRHSGPFEVVAMRLDFADWLKTLSKRDRKLAEKLALGETTGHMARLFRISCARVSQLRSELRENWRRFVGELTDAASPGVAPA